MTASWTRAMAIMKENRSGFKSLPLRSHRSFDCALRVDGTCGRLPSDQKHG